MAHCYVCNTEIRAENIYREHIILNALGGRLKSKDLFCKECAEASYFHEIDTALAEQLNPIGLLLGIKRHRKGNPSIKATMTDTGEQISLGKLGKPSVLMYKIEEVPTDGESESIYISAPNEKQMRNALRKLQGDYPGLNVEEILKSTTKEKFTFSEPVQFHHEIGGEKLFRAICKMAIGFYLSCGGSSDYIVHLIPYLKGEQAHRCVQFFYPDSSTAYDGEQLKVFHKLYFRGNPSESILFAYVELFSTFKYIILLSDNYTSEDIQKSYIFNVIDRTIVEASQSFELSRMDILSILKNSVDQDSITNSLDTLYEGIHERNERQAFNTQVSLIVDEYCKNLPEGTSPTEQMLMELAKRLATEFVLVLHKHELVQATQSNNPDDWLALLEGGESEPNHSSVDA